MVNHSRIPPQGNPTLHSLRSFASKHPAWSASALREFVKTHRRALVDAGALVKLGNGNRARLLIVEQSFIAWVMSNASPTGR